MELSGSLVKAASLVHDGPRDDGAGSWNVASLAGLLVEIVDTSPSSVLTAAVELVHEAQEIGEPCVWVTTVESAFYAPDLARSGVDLEALLVVRVPDLSAVARSAEYLVRSGGVGVLIADFTSSSAGEIDRRFAPRIVPLARTHGTAVICLTPENRLGSLVTVRAEAVRERNRGDSVEGTFCSVVRITKDRRYGAGEEFRRMRYGPDGVY